MRELAAIVLDCFKAIEGVVDVIAGSSRPAERYWHPVSCEYDESS